MAKELPNELVVLTRTHQLLAEAKTFEDFKTIRNKAQAARLYARSAQLGLHIQIHAAELTLECERRAGLVISEIVLSNGGRPGKDGRQRTATRLKDLGINKSQSSRWQRVAELREDLFQQYLAECRSAGREPTSRGLLQRAKQVLARGLSQKRSRPLGSRTEIHGSRPGAGAGSRTNMVNDEAAIIADLRLHHKQLIEHLSDYCGTGPLREPTSIQRRYIKHLLFEIERGLTELAEFKPAAYSRTNEGTSCILNRAGID